MEGDGTRTEVGGLVDGVADRVFESAVILAGGLSVSDTNDQNGLLRLAEFGQDDRINDLLAKLGAEGSEALVPLATEDLVNLRVELVAGKLPKIQVSETVPAAPCGHSRACSPGCHRRS